MIYLLGCLFPSAFAIAFGAWSAPVLGVPVTFAIACYLTFHLLPGSAVDLIGRVHPPPWYTTVARIAALLAWIGSIIHACIISVGGAP